MFIPNKNYLKKAAFFPFHFFLNFAMVGNRLLKTKEI